jgi:hypothetical protein
MVSKLGKSDPGCFIPNPDFLAIPDPEVKKAPDPADLDP